MIGHLEKGTCHLNINAQDLNSFAASCKQGRVLVNDNYYDDMINFEEIPTGENPFRCPTCKTPLPNLSGLFQHVHHSAICGQDLNRGTIGKLVRWLERQCEQISHN